MNAGNLDKSSIFSGSQFLHKKIKLLDQGNPIQSNIPF